MLILQADPRAEIRCLAFSPDGETLAVAGERFAGVGLYVLARENRLRRYGRHTGAVTSLAFAPSGVTVASAHRTGIIHVWGAADGVDSHAFQTFPLSRRGVHVAFSPTGDTLAAGCAAWWGSAPQVRRWRLSGDELMPFRGHTAQITALAYSPDGQTLATGSRDRSICLWDTQTGRERGGFANRVIDFLRQFGLGKTDEDLRSLMEYENEFRALAFAPDGRTLAAAAGWRATLWDVATGRLLANLKGHIKQVDCVAFAPDGRTLATASRDGTVRFWDVSAADGGSAGLKATYAWGIGKVYSVAFAPDGLRAAAGGDGGQVVVWDVDG